jgi:hypothetical protein
MLAAFVWRLHAARAVFVSANIASLRVALLIFGAAVLLVALIGFV